MSQFMGKIGIGCIRIICTFISEMLLNYFQLISHVVSEMILNWNWWLLTLDVRNDIKLKKVNCNQTARELKAHEALSDKLREVSPAMIWTKVWTRAMSIKGLGCSQYASSPTMLNYVLRPQNVVKLAIQTGEMSNYLKKGYFHDVTVST